MGNSSKNVLIHSEGVAALFSSLDVDDKDSKTQSRLTTVKWCTAPENRHCICYLDQNEDEQVIICFV
jgi:hypothetical protein